MIAVLILTHGGLAPELLTSARKIVARDLENFVALALDWEDGLDEGMSKLEPILESLSDYDGVLILTDIFGGTPTNVAARFRDPGRVEVVSGVNLPMVVRLGCLGVRSLPLDQLTTWIRDKGRSSICSSEALPPVPATASTISPCED